MASKKACYGQFKLALTAGMAKLDEYYHCSGILDAHIIAIGKIDITIASMLANVQL
jgi:hypothetical protein